MTQAIKIIHLSPRLSSVLTQQTAAFNFTSNTDLPGRRKYIDPCPNILACLALTPLTLHLKQNSRFLSCGNMWASMGVRKQTPSSNTISVPVTFQAYQVNHLRLHFVRHGEKFRTPLRSLPALTIQRAKYKTGARRSHLYLWLSW